MARRSGTGAAVPPWSGKGVAAARELVATWLPAPCGKCGKPVKPGTAFVVGHKLDRWSHPELTWAVDNWQPEHKPCSDASGQAAVIAKAKAEARRELGFSPEEGSPQSPPRSEYTHTGLEEPAATSVVPSYDPTILDGHSWLSPFLVAPADASHPLAMSAPHPDAVGSYGADCIEWVRNELGIVMRWWQQLAVTRQLEHRADGSLCWSTVIESCPRRAGKSVRLRCVALWRMAHPEIFGEPQLVLHCGRDLPIVREIHRAAWRWVEEQKSGDGWKVKKAFGNEEIETGSGDRWLVRSVHGVFGYDVSLGMVDEAWDVEPRVVDEGLEPATLERSSPQLVLTSTAHRRATSLMRKRLGAALKGDDPTTLLLLWGAPVGADPAAEETWRAASPHWTEQRREMIRSKYEAALAGQEDPEADDPDPMRGFECQYLNLWHLREPRAAKGNAVTTEDDWSELVADAPTRVPDAIAIEGWFSDGVSVARAWKVGAASVVSVTDHPTAAEAAEELRASGFKGRALVGASLATDPAFKGLRVTPTSGATRTTVADLARLLSESAIEHDGAEHLTRQVLALRTTASADGFRVRSTGRADAIKSAVWAVVATRSGAAVGKPRILVANTAKAV